ncbi:hypothetical protein P7H25_09645 [Paenibacillus larvae]|nr:hypothetical protein [Paenibacillus larvae]MDT2255854.1 hypothetical protein [Paenibacillus larvae]
MTKGRTTTYDEREVKSSDSALNINNNYAQTADKFQVSYHAYSWTNKYLTSGDALQDRRGKRKSGGMRCPAEKLRARNKLLQV